jgi:hypothetical protein
VIAQETLNMGVTVINLNVMVMRKHGSEIADSIEKYRI